MNLWGIIKGLLIQEETDRTKQLSVEVNSSATTGTRTTVQSSQTADRTLNLPDADDTLVGRNTTDTLTNKTIDGDDNTLQDIDLPSLKVQAPDAGKFLLRDGLGNVVSGNTVPNGTVVGDTDTQTLENKTIDGTAATGNNTITADMSNMTYDNSTSGLTATDGQAAVDEVEGRVDTVEANKIDGPGTHADNLLLKTDGVDSNTMQTTGISIDDLNNVTGVNDLTVNGNLQVDGTTTSVNSATLEVTDANITVNNNGNDATAEGAGLTVERTGTDGSIVYEDALTSKFKIGALGSEVEVMDVSSLQTVTNKDMSDPTNNVDTASADSLTRLTGNQQVVTIPDTATPDNLVLEDFQQVLTNKDIDGQTASDTSRITLPKNTTAGLDALTDKEGTVAYDTDLDTVVYNDGTGWNRLSGGQGGINYINYPDAENGNTDGWNTYNDASGSTPIDGVGGSALVAFSAVNASTLRGNYYYNLLDSAGSPGPQGSGVSTDFSIDEADTESTLQVSFDYASLGGYVSGYVKVFIYDIDNATLIGAVSNEDDGDVISHSAPSKRFLGEFNTTDSLNYRLIFHYTTTDTTGSILNFDNVRVYPFENLLGANANEIEEKFLTSDVSINTTLGDLTFSNLQIGKTYEIRLQVFGQALTAETGFVLQAIHDGSIVSTYSIGGDSGSVDSGNCSMVATFEATTNVLTFVTSGIDSPGSGIIFGNGAKNETFVQLEKRNDLDKNIVSGVELNQKTVSVLATSAGGVNFSSGSTADMVYELEEIDTHNAYDNSTGIFTAPKNGEYEFLAQASFNATTPGTGLMEIQITDLSNSVLRRDRSDIDSTTMVVDVSSSLYLEKGEQVKVRLLQSNGAGRATTASTAGYHALSIKSVQDYKTYGVVKRQGYVEASLARTSTGIPAVSTWADILEIELEPGTWDLQFQAAWSQGSAGTVFLGISDISGNVDPGDFGIDKQEYGETPTGGVGLSGYIFKNNITVSQNTTYYAKFQRNNTATQTWGGTFSARRID